MTLDPVRMVLIALFVLLPFAGYVKGCSDEKQRFEDFKRVQAALAAAQEAHTKQVIAENRTAKEKADAENAAARIALERMRKQRSRTVFLPAPAPDAVSPATATIERSELERALQNLDGGVQSLIDEGDTAIVDLNSARRWAQKAQ